MIELDSKMISWLKAKPSLSHGNQSIALASLTAAAQFLKLHMANLMKNDIVRIDDDYGRTAITTKTQIVATI